MGADRRAGIITHNDLARIQSCCRRQGGTECAILRNSLRATSISPPRLPADKATTTFASEATRKRKLMAKLNINGSARDVEVEPETPLLWVIREQVGLTGT